MKKEEYNKKLKAIKPDYELLEEYENYDGKANFIHNLCGNKFQATPHNMLRKNSGICPFCFQSKNTTLEQLKYKLKNFLNDEYELVDEKEYENLIKNVHFRHKKCGTIFYPVPRVLLNKETGCPNPECSGFKNKAYTPEEVKKEIFDLTNGEYKVISNYQKENIPIKIKHIKCGHIQMSTRRNFVYNDVRCPYCYKRRSKLEEAVIKILEENNIAYERDVKFEGMKRNSSYDFYIEEFDLVLELDGEQHFLPFHKIKNSEMILYERKVMDQKKNKFLKKFDIRFLRIHFRIKKDDLKNILLELINKKGKLSSTTIEKYTLYYQSYKKIYNEIDYYTLINKNYFDDI